MSENKIIDDGSPAFPCGPFGQTMHGEDGREWHQHDRLPGMTLRQYAAIKLCVPDSGIPWLDDMIQTSLRDRFAGQALAGMAASAYWSENIQADRRDYLYAAASAAYGVADAMIERRKHE